MARPTKAQAAERAVLHIEGRKRCTVCSEVKLHENFALDRDSWDGLKSSCRPCSRRRHGDAARAQQAKYRAANKDKIRERDRKRQADKGESLKAQAAARRSYNRQRWMSEDPYSNPELKRCPSCKTSLNRVQFSRHSTSHDGLNKYCKPCANGHNAARRARKLAQWVEDVDRRILWERDKGICYLCDQPADPEDWHMDHVHPLHYGGEHSYTNTAVTHPTCNMNKRDCPAPAAALARHQKKIAEQ